jgi:hypothetical protein
MDHLDRDDTNEMQQVLEPLYGAQVRSWNINIGVYEAFGQLVLDARQCRPAMELVPAPYHAFTPQKCGPALRATHADTLLQHVRRAPVPARDARPRGAREARLRHRQGADVSSRF